MKKNNAKTAKAKQEEYRSPKEIQEDRLFGRMLRWLVATVLVECVMLLVNRFYVHSRVDELDMLPVLHTVLAVAAVAGVVLFVACLFWANQIRKKGEEGDPLMQIILAASFLVLGVGCYVMRSYGVVGAPLILGLVPALGVLVLVYYLYQKEFFACAAAGGLGILGMWLYRVVGAGGLFYGYLVCALVVIGAGAFLAVKLKGKDGVITVKGKEIALLQPGAAYPAYFVTAVISAVILVFPLALGAAVAYYAIWVMAAWLFILAVYFTSKLM